MTPFRLLLDGSLRHESLLYGLLTWAGCFQIFACREALSLAGSSKQVIKTQSAVNAIGVLRPNQES